MPDISVAILGLDRIGASIALALKKYNASGGKHHFAITGYDMRSDVAKEATKQQVVADMANRPHSAAAQKDIVVIALPYSDVRAAYERIGENLRPGAVVIDTSPLKQPSLEWAAKYLPETAHLVGVTPVLNPQYLFERQDDLAHAREDLFDGGAMLLAPGPSCIKDAVELAVDFSRLLGANPRFVDPAEHDGLIAATEGLPSLLGVALFYTLCQSQGWSDSQRMINPAFGAITSLLFSEHPDDIRDLWLNNRENLVHCMDDLLNTLRGFRAALAQNDRAAVEAAVIETSKIYEQWYNRRHKDKWDDVDKGSMPGAMDMLSRGLMGGYISDKLTGKKDDQ